MPRASLWCLVLSVAAGFGCAGQGPLFPGSGVPKSEARAIGDPKSVEIHGQGQIDIEIGQSAAMELTADDNIIGEIVTETRGDTLLIRTPSRIQPKTPIVMRLRLAELNALAANGAPSVVVKGLSNEKLAVNGAGAPVITLEGQATVFTASLSGAGKLDASGLKAQDATVVTAGAADADLSVERKLDAVISGAGSIEYTGDPVVTSKVLGAGAITKKP